ncbi:MAG: DNA polymerase ligase N-terminal domain-containing protein [Bacteroidia bacterium]
MALEKYNKKRDFDETDEPAGKVKKTRRGKLKFVVQKHDASRLHYDFRLEMNGVLKSWAVPKGPSMNPKDKRLAMMVEDHPFDYKDFEGTIPEGNYGAGTVMVWDEGTYHPIEEAKTTKAEEKLLLDGLEKGDLKFILEGKKLKGEFVIFRFKTAGENAWLLMKKDDEFATDEDILEKDKSVKTKRSMAQITKES